jgi:hypothetical protein
VREFFAGKESLQWYPTLATEKSDEALALLYKEWADSLTPTEAGFLTYFCHENPKKVVGMDFEGRGIV